MSDRSNRTIAVVAIVVAAVLLFWVLPGWVKVLAVVAIIAVPVLFVASDPQLRTRITRAIRSRREPGAS